MTARDIRLLTSREVAARMGVDQKTVARWAQHGKLHAIRTPGGVHLRFREDEIEDIIQSQTEYGTWGIA